jgi:hypothetical protein
MNARKFGRIPTTSAAAASTEHGHFFQLGWDGCFSFTQDGDKLAGRLRIVGGKVGIRGTFHAGTLQK